jgi:restriction system protein
MANVWIFSNNRVGYYEDSDWDTDTILKTKNYYFKKSEPNRSKVKKGDQILLREYGTGFWATCEIAEDWIEDKDATQKHGVEAGWFPITKIKKWKVVLPYEVIKTELYNQNHRLRIAKSNDEDKSKVDFAKKIYRNLGYGDTHENFYILESGIEEAVKANLSQLNLELAEDEIQQQCNLGIGVGRTDLICRDKTRNYVVLELKAVHSSDNVVGQILRYMGYIRENWAEKEGKDVKGIILTPSYDEQLRLAAKEAGIKVLRLRIS